MAKWMQWLERAFGGGPSGPKRIRTLRMLLIVGAVGAALMLLNSFLKMNPVEPSHSQSPVPPADQDQETFGGTRVSASDNPFDAIEQQLEMRLKDILEKVVGVSNVDVLVTVDSTGEQVYAQNDQDTQSVTEETDPNGGRRYITSTTKNGTIVLYEVAGEQKPVITKTISPRIRGIIVVAKGAENTAIRHLITDAVSKGVNVPVSRISVVPRKQ
ncbi:stage III sporulation protein AG [Paenibacillus protaetiae]|uniref:Stage III sporulation protein AG n=1 Tax=Paenibacillus protaetiae TaxID=2509456 RepID=A0A4P6ESZ3_9BACL|nr:stage III sporulation protein AG [Paenibacillus protaetiae]QAY66250.1 stage III sporulation protein AG [Paenibacillus protaetiae]